MNVDKAQLVEMLRGRGDHALADRVNHDLPDVVSTEEHPYLFQGLELDLDAGDAARHAEPMHD